MSQSHHSGIERVTIGKNTNIILLSQSHHSGIERIEKTRLMIEAESRNRTTVGLKEIHKGGIKMHLSPSQSHHSGIERTASR